MNVVKGRVIITPSGHKTQYYRPKEAGAMLGISDQSVRKHIRNGLLKSIRWPGNRLSIEAGELERFAQTIMGLEVTNH